MVRASSPPSQRIAVSPLVKPLLCSKQWQIMFYMNGKKKVTGTPQPLALTLYIFPKVIWEKKKELPKKNLPRT